LLLLVAFTRDSCSKNLIPLPLFLDPVVTIVVFGFGDLWRKLSLALASADNGCACLHKLPCWGRCRGLQILLVCQVKTWLIHPWDDGGSLQMLRDLFEVFT
jgi:hypothetical protein